MTKKKKINAGWAEKNFLELSSEGCVSVNEVRRGDRILERGTAWISKEWVRMAGP